MPRAGSGAYTLPGAVNPVAAGDVIEANWANTTLNDIETALSDSLSRSGSGPMTAPLELANGSVGTPALSFDSDTDTGLYRIGADNLGVSIGGVKVIDVAAASVTFAQQPIFAGTPSSGSHLINKTYGDANYAPIANIGNLTLIKEISVTAVAAIDFLHGADGVVFDTTYDEYLFQLIDVNVGAAADIAMRFSSDAGVSYAATNYTYAQHLINTSGTASASHSTAGTYIPVGDGSATASFSCYGWIHLLRTAASVIRCLVDTTSMNTNRSRRGMGSHTEFGDTYEGVRFLSSSGSNFVAQGKIRMYGRKI